MTRGKKIFAAYQLGLVIWAFAYLLYPSAETEPTKIDFTPIYKDAIKAVDPLEILKQGDNSQDYATF